VVTAFAAIAAQIKNGCDDYLHTILDETD